MDKEILYIFLRTILILGVLFVLTKLMGKKQLSQLNIYDYLIGITIGNVAAEISIDIDKNIIGGVICLITYVLFYIVVSYYSMKNLKFRKFFGGNPTVLIKDGNILVKSLKKEGIDIDSLEEEARLNGYFDLSEINYAILETNGQISFMPKVENDYVTNGDMKLKVREKKLSVNLIQDGVVMEDNLLYVNKDIKWLDGIVKSKGYDSISDVFLFIYNDSKDIKLYGYEKRC